MPAKDTKKSILVIIFLPANFKEMVTCAERFPQEMIWLPQEFFFGVVTYELACYCTSALPLVRNCYVARLLYLLLRKTTGRSCVTIYWFICTDSGDANPPSTG